MTNPKITPFLWLYKGKATEAAEFYTSVFDSARILKSKKLENIPTGTVEIITIELFGQEITLMGGSEFKFNESFSFVINCKDQEEIDYYWEKLSAVPEKEACGWCRDRFGLTWQIVPENVAELLKTDAAVQALLQMKKFVIADLQ